MSVVLAYKNFAANRAISHIGLGVTALNTAKTLRSAGINADVWPIISAAELHARLQKADASHVVISAPWIPTVDLAHLCSEFKETQFAVTCHSNLGFLQADPSAMRMLREGLELRRTSWNFRMPQIANGSPTGFRQLMALLAHGSRTSTISIANSRNAVAIPAERSASGRSAQRAC